MALPVVLLILSTIIVTTLLAMIVRNEGTAALYFSGAATNGLLAAWVFIDVFLPRDGLPAILALLAAGNLSATATIAFGRGLRIRRDTGNAPQG